MYHHSRADSLSTGEPPTPPLVSRLPNFPESLNMDPVQSRTASNSDQDEQWAMLMPMEEPSFDALGFLYEEIDKDPVQSRTATNSDADRPRSLTALEQDSGYEASPCSMATNSCGDSDLHFFGSGPGQAMTISRSYVTLSGGRALEIVDDDCDNDLPLVADDQTPSPDDVFEDSSNFVLLEPEEEWGQDCSEASSCRAASSATLRSTPVSYAAADGELSNCDISHSSSDSSSRIIRPSSLPIRIPTIESHIPMTVHISDCACSPTVDSRLQPVQTSPRPRPHTPLASSVAHPRSWPSSIFSWWNRSSPTTVLVSNFLQHSNQPRVPQRRLNRPVAQTQRGRRRLIDSDASSSDENLSDDLESEESSYQEIFSMAEDEPPTTRVSPLGPLPDIILHSSPSIIRRNRSVSVSLPLQADVHQHIGRSLRRLSDQFEMDRVVYRGNCIRRRGTMDSTYHRSS